MHSHNHANDSDGASNRIGWAFFLNVVFTIIEFIGGWLTNSTAIMADAVHDLGDSLSIGTAWGLNKLGDKEANNTFSYGYKRFFATRRINKWVGVNHRLSVDII